MVAGACIVTVEPLTADDVVVVAQCILLDVEMFPYPSAIFGLRDPAARAWVARDVRRDGPWRVVRGFAAGHVRRGTLHIEGLAVDGGSRRRGVGRALVRQGVERAGAEGIRTVSLHVSVANRAAIALYSAEGFDVYRRLRSFYPPAACDGEADAFEMQLRIGAARSESRGIP